MITHKNLITEGSNGKPIVYDLFLPNVERKVPIVIYAHGFCGFKDWGNFDLIAAQFVQEGFAFLKFNFSHNGTSPAHPAEFVDFEAFGENNYSKELEDLKRITNLVSGEKPPLNPTVDTNEIYLIGHSMGGGMAILHASQDIRIKKLATWASISVCKTPWGNWPILRIEQWKERGVEYYQNGRTRQDLPMYFQLYEDYQKNKDRYDILSAMAQLTIPVLIVHGTEDTSVKYESALSLSKKLPTATLYPIKTDHVFGRKHPWPHTFLPPTTIDLVNKTISFFKETH